ncbi:ATP-dependent zinc protease [Spongiibacter sp. KMU-158]|uniref:ATP-dependent zinc protease n=1 Tax=Spongiibacter pelagi TaxID=2760804 RepID=A0A927BYU1_9GAMM|nr:RimK/LysX family protein [Spongiibacter pelagi]MBD2857544.1 ATP-dependent zinc protease [Spongiibacter pelagi]
MKIIALGMTLLLTSLAACASNKDIATRPIFGTSEYVYIEEFDQCFLAKIDTGAGSASINAINIKLDEGPKADDDMVSFDLVLPDGSLKPYSLPVSKYVLVKRRAADIGKDGRAYNRRPSVDLHLNIGGTTHLTSVNLADRRSFSKAMLIGHGPLKAFHALVDVADEKVQGNCAKSEPSEPEHDQQNEQADTTNTDENAS